MFRTSRVAVCFVLGFGAVHGFAHAQYKLTLTEKWKEKEKDEHEEKVIAKIAEKAAKMPEAERDRWLRDVVRATPVRLFEKIDRDGNGVLERDEWPDALRAVTARVDDNRDGKIDRDEYREYFAGRLRKEIETRMPKKSGSEKNAKPSTDLVGVRSGKLPPGLPPWFPELDTDRDGQIGLYEWRAAGLPIADYREMDLDGDGILTPDEFLRYVKLFRPDGVTVELPGQANGEKGKK